MDLNYVQLKKSMSEGLTSEKRKREKTSKEKVNIEMQRKRLKCYYDEIKKIKKISRDVPRFLK